jgi:hypothetical protein
VVSKIYYSKRSLNPNPIFVAITWTYVGHEVLSTSYASFKNNRHDLSQTRYTISPVCHMMLLIVFVIDW